MTDEALTREQLLSRENIAMTMAFAGDNMTDAEKRTHWDREFDAEDRISWLSRADAILALLPSTQGKDGGESIAYRLLSAGDDGWALMSDDDEVPMFETPEQAFAHLLWLHQGDEFALTVVSAPAPKPSPGDDESLSDKDLLWLVVSAVRDFVYETTHLSPMKDNGSHVCTVPKELLDAGRMVLGMYGSRTVATGTDIPPSKTERTPGTHEVCNKCELVNPAAFPDQCQRENCPITAGKE